MILKNTLFLICCLLFWTNQALEKAGIIIPFVHAYADDLLAMPVVFGITLQSMRWIYPGGGLLVFSKTHVISGWLYFSLLMEAGLPRISATYTADIWDVVCYGIGSLAFWFWINLPEAKESHGLEKLT